MLLLRQSLAFLCFLIFLIVVSVSGAETNEKILPLKAYFDDKLRYSPDKKYFVDISGEGNDTGRLIVYKITRDKKNVLHKTAVLKRRLARHHSSNGFTWLPKHPHAFVLAHRAPDGRAFIALWKAGSTFKVLRRAKLPGNIDPDAFVFVLDGISASGRILVYRVYDATTKQKERTADQRFKVKHRLPLPI